MKDLFLKKYKEKMLKTMLQLNPTWKKKDVEKIIEKTIEKRLRDPDIVLDNNYTHQQKQTTLISVLDWAMDRKPLIAGNGTFYKNQNEALNPIRAMLDEWADNRSAFKKQMFGAGETYGVDSRQYKDFDRKQLNEKINMNSYYGGSGAKSSAFYSTWSGPATTLTAQSVISTAEQFFESFLVNNYQFINMTELIEWIECVMKDYTELDDFIFRKKREELIEKLLVKIIEPEDSDYEILQNFLMDLSDDEITFIYYKNNMIEFIKNHIEIQELFISILSSIENLYHVDEKDSNWIDKIPKSYKKEFQGKTAKAWNKYVNKNMFMDPNSPPKNIIPYLEVLTEYIMKYIYVPFLSFDRIYRLKNFKRNVVTVIDTDSNFLSLDTLMIFLIRDLFNNTDYGRDPRNNIFILVNTITYVITKGIKDMLYLYSKRSNIPEEYRRRFDMKNEFFNELTIIGAKKKRYITEQTLREGNYNSPPKINITGFDFKKSTTSEYAEKIFVNLIKEYIIKPDVINVKDIINGLRKFKDEIITSIRNGEITFLPNGNAKELGAYKDPAREQSIRGVIAWNYLYPTNAIEFPSKVSLLKMNIFTEKDIEPLKEKNPEMYQTIMEKIFLTDDDFFTKKKFIPGITYVNIKDKNWFEKIPQKYRTKYKKLGPAKWNEWVDEGIEKHKFKEEEMEDHYEYSKRGLQVLAIPSNTKIPEWALDYVDYDTMVNTIIAPFKPVLEIFCTKFPEIGKTKNGVNRKTSSLSNIIKF